MSRPTLRPFAFALSLLANVAQAQDLGDIEEWSAPAPASEGIESFESPATAAPSQLPLGRVYGTVRARSGVDTSFDSARGEPLAENVFDFGARLTLGIDAKVAANLRVVAEGRGSWRGTAQRGFKRDKAICDPELGEAFVDLYTPQLDLRVGNQVVVFGANPAFAPADALNPRDLRESFLLAEPFDLRLPNLAARALGTVGRVNWTAAYFPFFKPHKYNVTGQDEALAQPVLGLAFPYNVDPSIEDAVQPHLLETERPRAVPWLGDLGLRATTEIGRVEVGASWVWVNEKLPSVTLDPELAAFVRARTRGVEPDPAVLVSLQERGAAGETLVTGRYDRQHLISAEAQTLLGSAQLDVDVSWSPAQTLFDSALRPIRKQTFSWVVGLTQAADSKLLYNVTWVGLAVPDLPSDGYLFLLEPATAAGAPRTVWFQALFGTVGYRFLDDRLEISLRGAVEPVQRSWALAPRVTWRGFSRFELAVGAELYEGKAYSPFGYFGRNDQVLALFSADLF